MSTRLALQVTVARNTPASTGAGIFSFGYYPGIPGYVCGVGPTNTCTCTTHMVREVTHISGCISSMGLLAFIFLVAAGRLRWSICSN